MKKFKAILILISFLTNLTANAQKVSITTEQNASDRELFAAEYLQKKLSGLGYTIVGSGADYRVS